MEPYQIEVPAQYAWRPIHAALKELEYFEEVLDEVVALEQQGKAHQPESQR